MRAVFADTSYWLALLISKDSLQFRGALSLYEQRDDKRWSLTDCASFQIMRRDRMTQALTYDHHFEQTGFQALLRG
jgi:uncharacterized protein